LIVAKVVCVVSGYERRLPNIASFDEDDYVTDDLTKQIYDSGRKAAEDGEAMVGLGDPIINVDNVDTAFNGR